MAEFNLPFGVRVANSDPIDKDRYIAVDIAARNSVLTNGRAHAGLQVYVESNSTLYILKGVTNNDWEIAGVGDGGGKVSYDYHQAQQLAIPFIDVSPSSKIEVLSDDAILGGFHALIYVEEAGKYFAFSRATATKVFIYEDLNDLDTRTVIDISDASYTGGVENAVYNETTGKIYFCLGDGSYAQTNTLVKSIDVFSNAVATVINYNTGINPGYPIVTSIGGFIYTAEGNYGFKINKFDTDGNFISAITNGMSGVVGAHGWVMEDDAFYVASFINYNGQNWMVKVDIATFTVTDSFDYALPGANLGNGNGIFTNQLAIVGQFIYLPTENLSTNFLYRVNKDDLSKFDALSVLKTNQTSNLYFAQELDGKVYYGGADDTFGYWDVYTGENVLLENPFPYSLNQLTASRDQLLVAGFDVYPVSGTGYVGKGRFFKAIQSSQEASALKVEVVEPVNGQTSHTVAENAILDDDQWSVIVNGDEQVSRTSNVQSTWGNISIDHATGVITFHNTLNIGDLVMIKYN